MKIFVITLLIFFATTTFASENTEPRTSESATVNELRSDQTYQQIILTPRWTETSNEPNFVVIKPDTDFVAVKGKSYTWQKESESFEQFRHHYMLYWGLFMVMMMLDASWAE